MGWSIKKVSGMANNKTLVCDINVLIYFFSGNLNTREIISQFSIAVSSMSCIELQTIHNQTTKERNIIKRFFGRGYPD